VVDAAKPNGFDRPWSAAAAGETENDSTIITRPSPPRARDATPSVTDLQADE
jgi:competence protein ComEC